jgi:hypothetical protein
MRLNYKPILICGLTIIAVRCGREIMNTPDEFDFSSKAISWEIKVDATGMQQIPYKLTNGASIHIYQIMSTLIET